MKVYEQNGRLLDVTFDLRAKLTPGTGESTYQSVGTGRVACPTCGRCIMKITRKTMAFGVGVYCHRCRKSYWVNVTDDQGN